MQVERGGKFKERARLGIRFHTLVLADGTRVPICTETIYRDGDAPGNSSAAKVGGGAVGGAILGAILGGAKGAAIGATAGAGAGTRSRDGRRSQRGGAAAGTPMTVRILRRSRSPAKKSRRPEPVAGIDCRPSPSHTCLCRMTAASGDAASRAR